jgi:hypothetical protein
VPQFESTDPAKDGKTAETSLSYRQERAIVELLQQPNMQAAAASAGVTARTLRRWLRQREFSRRYEKQRSLQLECIHEVLRLSAMDAVQVLIAVSQNKMSPPAARVSAASRLIDYTFKVGELASIEKRLQELEQIAKGRP